MQDLNKEEQVEVQQEKANDKDNYSGKFVILQSGACIKKCRAAVVFIALNQTIIFASLRGRIVQVLTYCRDTLSVS